MLKQHMLNIQVAMRHDIVCESQAQDAFIAAVHRGRAPAIEARRAERDAARAIMGATVRAGSVAFHYYNEGRK